MAESGTMRPQASVRTRALNYALALPASVKGQHGHDAAFRVAAAICQGFALEREEALAVMRDGRHRRLRFGVTDDGTFSVGLMCGGEVEILIEPVA